MILEQAEELAAGLLRELRYGTDGYFWSRAEERLAVAAQYGHKDIEGTTRLEEENYEVGFLIKELLEKAKPGGGYLGYWLPR